MLTVHGLQLDDWDVSTNLCLERDPDLLRLDLDLDLERLRLSSFLPEEEAKSLSHRAFIHTSGYVWSAHQSLTSGLDGCGDQRLCLSHSLHGFFDLFTGAVCLQSRGHTQSGGEMIQPETRSRLLTRTWWASVRRVRLVQWGISHKSGVYSITMNVTELAKFQTSSKIKDYSLWILNCIRLLLRYEICVIKRCSFTSFSSFN